MGPLVSLHWKEKCTLLQLSTYQILSHVLYFSTTAKTVLLLTYLGTPGGGHRPHISIPLINLVMLNKNICSQRYERDIKFNKAS
jgi:hypothetical protein